MDFLTVIILYYFFFAFKSEGAIIVCAMLKIELILVPDYVCISNKVEIITCVGEG